MNTELFIPKKSGLQAKLLKAGIDSVDMHEITPGDHRLKLLGDNVAKYAEWENKRRQEHANEQSFLTAQKENKRLKEIHDRGLYLATYGGKITKMRDAFGETVEVLHVWKEERDSFRTRQLGGYADGGGEYTSSKTYMVTRKKWVRIPVSDLPPKLRSELQEILK